MAARRRSREKTNTYSPGVTADAYATCATPKGQAAPFGRDYKVRMAVSGDTRAARAAGAIADATDVTATTPTMVAKVTTSDGEPPWRSGATSLPRGTAATNPIAIPGLTTTSASRRTSR